MSKTSNFHETLQEDEVALPSPRATGLVFAAVATIAAVLLRHHWPAAATAGAAAMAFALVSWRAPARLDGLNRVWFRIGLALNAVVSPLVLAVLYAVAIVPFGLGMQLLRDPLRRRRDRSATTCWVPRDKTLPASSMRNQF